MLTDKRIRRVVAFDNPAPAADANIRFGLDKPARDNAAMCAYWDQAGAIIDGVKALVAEAAVYLPKLPNESNKDWKFRQSNAKLTNVFRDICEDLASRPFEAPISVDDWPEEWADFIDNVDGAGSDITSFSADTFFNGIAFVIDWIFVDYPNVPGEQNTDGSLKVRTIADERAMGIRPYWSHVRGNNMLEVRSEIGVNGIETLTYVRMREQIGDDLYVRIIERLADGVIVWELWKAKPMQARGKNVQREFTLDDDGRMSIPIIPLVPFSTGRRKGRSWEYYPALRDACDLQLVVFKNETGLEYAKVMTAYPMLSANGVKPAMAADGKTPLAVPIGPAAVLYAPPDGAGHAGSWEYIEPAATSLEFLRKDTETTITQLRELGRQPLTSQSGNLTTITTAVAAKKGNSAVQAWGIGLALTLTVALMLTALWQGRAGIKAKVKVFTDFDVDGSGNDELATLNTARSTGDLSQETYWSELQRRNVLSAEFDPEAEKAALLKEIPSGDGEETDAFGNPINPNKPGAPAPANQPKRQAA